MNSKKEELIEAFDMAINGIIDEVKKADRNEETVDDKNTLLWMMDVLSKIKNMVVQDQMPSKIDRDKICTHQIIDSWPHISVLGDLIIHAEVMYFNYD